MLNIIREELWEISITSKYMRKTMNVFCLTSTDTTDLQAHAKWKKFLWTMFSIMDTVGVPSLTCGQQIAKPPSKDRTKHGKRTLKYRTIQSVHNTELFSNRGKLLPGPGIASSENLVYSRTK